jgi:diguanylate cyclase (GGDEF)-like protein
MIDTMAAPRPLDAPVAGLGDAEALAKAWLLALIAARPLGEAIDVPVDRVGTEGPALIDAVVAALVSDEGLARLGIGGDAALLAGSAGVIAGASRPAEVVGALERLRGVLWAAIESASAGPPPPELASRLAHVCATVAETALAAGDALGAPAEPGDGGMPQIRVARPSESSLWLEALQRQLAEGGRSGHRFALLVVDLDAADRLRLAAEDDAAEAFDGVARAVREEVRRADVVAHEDDGRVWVIAGDTGRGGAAELALRIADAVEAAAALHGAPLTASIGIAVYPDDGRDATALTAQAEEGMFAARATGARVAGGTEPEGPNGGAPSGPWALS